MNGPGATTLTFQLSDSDFGAEFPLVERDGTGADQTVTVYGRIPANQYAVAGAYTADVAITLDY
jgi:spore coat protein U-like protein